VEFRETPVDNDPPIGNRSHILGWQGPRLPMAQFYPTSAALRWVQRLNFHPGRDTVYAIKRHNGPRELQSELAGLADGFQQGGDRYGPRKFATAPQLQSGQRLFGGDEPVVTVALRKGQDSIAAHDQPE
jgi:hypothetical protein